MSQRGHSERPGSQRPQQSSRTPSASSRTTRASSRPGEGERLRQPSTASGSQVPPQESSIASSRPPPAYQTHTPESPDSLQDMSHRPESDSEMSPLNPSASQHGQPSYRASIAPGASKAGARSQPPAYLTQAPQIKEPSQCPSMAKGLSMVKGGSMMKAASKAGPRGSIAPLSQPLPSYRTEAPDSAASMKKGAHSMRKATDLNRDHSQKPAPARSIVPVATQLNRDHSIRQPSTIVGGASQHPSTRHDGRASIKQKTQITGRLSHQPSELQDGRASFVPSAREIGAISTKSLLTSSRDQEMAARQSSYASLAPREQAEQDNWARSQIKQMDACPEGYDWKRVDGGYQCEKGGHGITDEMLQEGMGAVCSCGKEKKWEFKEGPYYPNGNGKFLFDGKKKFPGVSRPAGM